MVIDTNNYQCSPYLDFETVPIQVVRCKLENIVPKADRYPINFIRNIQNKFIGKRVQIRFTRKHVETFPLPVIVHILDESTYQPQSLPLTLCSLKSYILLSSIALSFLNFESILIQNYKVHIYEFHH